MEKQFIENNIVLLGQFKPAKFDKFFFVKNNLIDEEQFLDFSLFTPDFSNIITENLRISIHPNQIVIVNSKKISDNETIIHQIAKKIIQSDDVKINAIGFNFKWFIFIEKLFEYTQKTFFSPSNTVINKNFTGEDIAYGYYVSKNFREGRLRLDVKPTKVQKIDDNVFRDLLNFDFNFHIEDKKEVLINVLDEYNLYVNEVSNIINDYE